METRTIELTKEEAALLPLLYKVPLSTTVEAAPQVMKYKLLVDGLVKKAKEAFKETETPPSAQE
jgi:hypothetical protein